MRAGLTSAVALAAGAMLGVGCGSGGGTIDQADADALQQSLDQVAAAVSSGDCDRADAAVANVRSQISNLDVPARLQSNLERGARKLAQVAPGDCDEAAQRQETQTQTTETTTETTTPTVTTDTTPTETTQTQTTTTPTQTTTTPQDTTTDPTGGLTPETPTTQVPPPGDGSGGAEG